MGTHTCGVWPGSSMHVVLVGDLTVLVRSVETCEKNKSGYVIWIPLQVPLP